jgi:peptidoglycan-associated lipoprotein
MKNITKCTITAVAVLFFSLTGFSQAALKKAETAFDAHMYFDAIELYKQAYNKADDAKKAMINFKMGVASQEINDYKGAQQYFEKSIKGNYENPIVYKHLAEVLKGQMRYPDAITEFNNYKTKGGDAKIADLGVKSCELAQKWVDNPMRFKIENMAFNSKARDYAPCYSDKKYQTLIITSNRDGGLGGQDLTTGTNHTDIYETKLDKNGKWSNPVIEPPAISTPVNEGRGWVSKKGDMMFFTRCPEEKDKENKCGLYLAKKQGSTWGPAEKLPFSNDTVNFGHPCLSSDGKTLYFVSKMSGGFGGTDIWSCSYDAKSNAWGQPRNLGAAINTSGNEVYPTVSDDGKKFYFSSDYHPGLGGLDIFMTEVGGDGKMNKAVENLKYPINSGYDDFGIVFEGRKNRGFFTSNRDGGKGEDDIYSFYLPPLSFNAKGNIYCEGDAVGKGRGEPVESVKVKVIGSDGSITEIITGKDGGYTFKLKEKNTYTITTETGKSSKSSSFPKDGFLSNKDVRVVTTVGEDKSKEFVADFSVKPVVPDLRMPQILYALGSAELLPESKDSLNYLFNILHDNPSTVIELDAHTDSQGKPDANMTLSQARAESCVNFLVNEKGINVKRLVPKGFGQTQPLITDAQIKAATSKEERDALHAKNRRTAFKVLSFDFVDPDAPKPVKPTKAKADEEEEE